MQYSFFDNHKHIASKNQLTAYEIVDGVLQKRVKASLDMNKKTRGWLLEQDIFSLGVKEGIVNMLVIDEENHQVYQAKFQDFHELGIGVKKRFGLQICLPLKYWTIITKQHF